MRATDHLTPITAEFVREILHYDPETGVFTRLVRLGGRGKVGGRADRIHNGTGRAVVKIYDRLYYASRLAWLYMTGEWPAELIDHKNLDRADTRWENLREATKGENNANTRGFAVSGIKGVAITPGGRWVAFMKRGEGVSNYLGTFDTAEEASAAYQRAALDRHGEFARTA